MDSDSDVPKKLGLLGNFVAELSLLSTKPLKYGRGDKVLTLSHTCSFTLISPEQDSHSDSERDSDSQKSQNILTITQNISILHEPKLIY